MNNATKCHLGMHNKDYIVTQSNGVSYHVCSECTGKNAKLGKIKRLNKREWIVITEVSK